MIECKLKPMVENRYVNNNPLYKKFGHYMTPFYPIKGYGKNCWVVVANILVDFERYIQEGLNKEEIALRCVEFLNYRPKSKYGKKRRRKTLYGTFRAPPYRAKYLERGEEKYLQVLLVTEDRKNSNFWGEGQVSAFHLRR